MKLIESELEKLIKMNILVYDSRGGGEITERLCNLVYTVYKNNSKKISKIIRAYLDSEDYIPFKYNGQPALDIEFVVISGLTELFNKLGASTVGKSAFVSSFCESKIVIFEMENGDMMIGSY